MKSIAQQHEHKTGWVYLLIILVSLLIAWTVWNYFEYKGKELDIKSNTAIKFSPKQ